MVRSGDATRPRRTARTVDAMRDTRDGDVTREDYVKNCPSHSEAPSSRRARDEEQTCERPKNKTKSRVCGVRDPRHDPSSENPRRGVQHTTPLAASLELQRVLYYSAAASPVEHASDRPAASSCAACWLEEYGRGVALRRKEVLLLVRAERRARTRVVRRLRTRARLRVGRLLAGLGSEQVLTGGSYRKFLSMPRLESCLVSRVAVAAKAPRPRPAAAATLGPLVNL